MKTTLLSGAISALLLVTASAQAPTDPNPANSSRTLPAASARDGFTLRGTEPVITRDGVTSKVEREIIFPSGLRVLPNGNVTMRDGSTTALRPNQILTFDGVFENVALTPDGVAPLSSVTIAPSRKNDVGISARDGITVSGADVLITRNGVTERVTSEVRLPNGVTARADGSLVLANGEKFTLRPDQVLGLDGVLREAPVRPNPAGPSPSSSTPSTSAPSAR